MEIARSRDEDVGRLLGLVREAFGGPEEAELVRDLLQDPSAKPCLSLLATEEGEAVGHILFTRVEISPGPDSLPPSAPAPLAAILAPLAVLPSAQGKGVGGGLIREGLRQLARSGVELVFVLGHPGYYPRYGFRSAGAMGLEAPFPIPEEQAEAWMVAPLHPGILGEVKGRVICADALSRPELWRE